MCYLIEIMVDVKNDSEKGFEKKIINLGQGKGELLHKWADGTYHKTKEHEC